MVRTIMFDKQYSVSKRSACIASLNENTDSLVAFLLFKSCNVAVHHALCQGWPVGQCHCFRLLGKLGHVGFVVEQVDLFVF